MAGPDSHNDSNSNNHTFHPQDLINETLKTTLIMGGAGLFASTVQNTLQKRNVGPMGVFTVTGRTIGTFGMGRVFPSYFFHVYSRGSDKLAFPPVGLSIN